MGTQTMMPWLTIYSAGVISACVAAALPPTKLRRFSSCWRSLLVQRKSVNLREDSQIFHPSSVVKLRQKTTINARHNPSQPD